MSPTPPMKPSATVNFPATIVAQMPSTRQSSSTPIPKWESIPTVTSQSTITPDNAGIPQYGISLDTEKVDWIDAAVDTAGIVGEVASVVGTPGRVLWGFTEIVEGAGLGYDLYSAFYDENLRELSVDLVIDTVKETIPVLIPDVVRLAPAVGVLGNVFSLGQNIVPAIVLSPR